MTKKTNFLLLTLFAVIVGADPRAIAAAADVPSNPTVEVTKAPTPDMDGNSIGGSVNLRPRTVFDSSSHIQNR